MGKLKQRIPALAIALAIVLAFAVGVIPARAAIVTGIGYSFNTVTGELTVTTNAGTTAWHFDTSINTVSISLSNPNTNVTSVIIENGVTDIGDAAFWACYALTDVKFPTSLTTIGGAAFDQCSSISTIDLSGCTNLTTIGGYAFRVTGLSTIDLSSCTNLTTISNRAFSHCDYLSTVKFPKNTAPAIGTVVFDDSSTSVPSSVIKTVYFPKTETTPGSGTELYPETYWQQPNLADLAGWTKTPYAPAVPAIIATTDTSVELEEVYGAEYSTDGFATYRQNSPIFTGLTPNTQYTFAVRIAADTSINQWHTASAAVTVTATTNTAPPPTGGGNSPVPPIDETVKPGTDKPEEKPEVTEPEVTEPVAPTLPTGPQTAKPVTNLVIVDGVEYAVASYNINDNNYFKLRDLAAALNGTKKQFEVVYNAPTIELTSGAAYTKVGGELTGKVATENVIANPTDNRIVLDGKEIALTAYNVNNNNYFKLRDIGEAFDFSVVWEEATGNIIVDTSKGYSK